jgi:diacylglycerol kinase (ATP)
MRGGASPATPAWTTACWSSTRLGDASRLRVTRQTLDQVVRGPRRPLDAGPYLAARELWLATDPPRPLDLDGEVRGTTPVHIGLLPNALRVLVPPSFLNT